MAATVYLLCAVTSVVCAVLLVRSWFASPVRLLMWVALGFIGLAVNNVVLFTDRVLTPGTDLHVIRDVSGLAAVAILLFGLIWESR
ncbi:MAG TPA: DUF5985 family protein [Mycobacteriales bacterium]|nr:DUF5985 family protein [Mycobacteriales bacterium]